MKTNERLINRRQALLEAESKLNQRASLKTKEGRTYLSCLVMLAGRNGDADYRTRKKPPTMERLGKSSKVIVLHS